MPEMETTPSTVVMSPSAANNPFSTWVTFEYKNEAGYITRSIMLPREEWVEMGSPEQLTVTVAVTNSEEI